MVPFGAPRVRVHFGSFLTFLGMATLIATEPQHGTTRRGPSFPIKLSTCCTEPKQTISHLVVHVRRKTRKPK